MPLIFAQYFQKYIGRFFLFVKQNGKNGVEEKKDPEGTRPQDPFLLLHSVKYGSLFVIQSRLCCRQPCNGYTEGRATHVA